MRERDEILDRLKTKVSNNESLVSYFVQNLAPGPGVDGVRIALNTFEEDNDKSKLLESLEHIMELMSEKEKEEQEKYEMRKNKIELKALITSMLVERVATLPVATALRRLVDENDMHVMAAHDVYLQSNKNKSDFNDTMLRIGRRAVENRAPFQRNHTHHQEVLSIVSTLDLSPHSRDVLLKCIENGDPTVASAIQLYMETRDLEEFKEMLLVLVENREVEDEEEDEDEEATLMLSPDASIISHSSHNNTTFLSPAMSTMSSSNTSSSRNIDNLKKRVDSDRIFSTALRALTSGNDPLNSSEIALLQNMYDDNDMIMTVALDFYNSNNDMDELLDTLRTAVRAARSV